MNQVQVRERKKRTKTILVVGGLVAAVLAFAKVFLADVYRVNSGSMRPTIMGGVDERAEDTLELSEWVLVNYVDPDSVERFDLVVVEADDSSDPLVKRAGGLAGEQVAIVHGDLLVDGKRLPADTARPAPVLVFDDRFGSLRDEWLFAEPRWREHPGEWIVDAQDVGSSNYAETLMQLRMDLTDGYLRSDGVYVPGRTQVNDGILALEAKIDEGDGCVVMELSEEGDLFRAEFRVEGESARLRILRRNDSIIRALQENGRHDDLAWEIVHESPIEFARGSWHRLRFANVDNHLFVRVDGLEFVESYLVNVPLTNVSLSTRRRSLGTRVRFGADGVLGHFRRVRVYRDLFWNASGDYGVKTPYQLGRDEIFVLGDNSTYSTDSRTFGAVPLREVVGQPVAVVWPPDRARSLDGAEAEDED